MQGKVSMVIPCYNKVKYIGEMFNSILAQDWNNIELILVNDGSTDGTRQIISEYESRFLARGFETVIIDQENAGVCAAAKTGLERITGEYVCLVDSDDELDPKYVSTMAGWLEQHSEYDFAACEGITYTGSGSEKVFCQFAPREIVDGDSYLVERYLLDEIRPTVWIYMLRAEYFYKCCITETYCTQTKGSHEPGYIIPLLSFGGKLKFFPLPLYHFNSTGEGHSQFQRFEHAQKFYDEYNKLSNTAIERLPDTLINFKRKRSLEIISLFSKHIRLYIEANRLPDGLMHAESIFTALLSLANASFSITPPISRERTIGHEYLFYQVIINSLLARGNDVPITPLGRIIGYGALGRTAARLLPHLKGTYLEPTELWDIAGDGVTIKPPDFSSLTVNDIVLVLPSQERIVAEVCAQLEKTSCGIMSRSDIVLNVGYLIFPEFRESSLNLAPEGA